MSYKSKDMNLINSNSPKSSRSLSLSHMSVRSPSLKSPMSLRSDDIDFDVMEKKIKRASFKNPIGLLKYMKIHKETPWKSVKNAKEASIAMKKHLEIKNVIYKFENNTNGSALGSRRKTFEMKKSPLNKVVK